MSVNEITDFIIEICYERVGFSKKNPVIIQWNAWKKDLLLFGNKLIEKIPDPRNAKKPYQSFIRKKNTKSVKQPKTFENPNTVEIKSVVTEHPKIWHKLSKTIRLAKSVGSNIALYSDTKKKWKFFKTKKNVKLTKWAHAFKGYESSYNTT